MFGQKFFPYSTLQELNLDWILTKVKNILRFVPDDGYVGQILRRTKDGAEWSDEQGGGGAVNSVNGQTGTVVLTASDVGALPDTYTAPVTSVNTKTGAVVLDKTDIGLGNVSNVAQYSASNPPPYPVTSVNTKTGAVVLDKTDIGLGNVANVAQYSASNPPPYPVTSVNGQTGAVSLNFALKTGLLEYDLLASFTGNVATNVSLNYSADDYILVALFVYDNVNRISSVQISPPALIASKTFRTYGASSSEWGQIVLAPDYLSGEFNRTAASTTKVEFYGIFKKSDI